MEKVTTYGELLNLLSTLTEEQLACNLTLVDDEDEYVPLSLNMSIEEEDDVLDKYHPVLKIC